MENLFLVLRADAAEVGGRGARTGHGGGEGAEQGGRGSEKPGKIRAVGRRIRWRVPELTPNMRIPSCLHVELPWFLRAFCGCNLMQGRG